MVGQTIQLKGEQTSSFKVGEEQRNRQFLNVN